jgi:hypothetical protein
VELISEWLWQSCNQSWRKGFCSPKWMKFVPPFLFRKRTADVNASVRMCLLPVLSRRAWPYGFLECIHSLVFRTEPNVSETVSLPSLGCKGWEILLSWAQYNQITSIIYWRQQIQFPKHCVLWGIVGDRWSPQTQQSYENCSQVFNYIKTRK